VVVVHRRGRGVLLGGGGGVDDDDENGEKAGRSSARHEGETVKGRTQVEPNMGVHQGLVAGRPVLSDVYMLGELRGGPFPVRAERQGGQAVGQVQAQ